MTDLLTLLVQQSVNGVYLGCLYVMVALGLTLIYGVLNQINFAHADFVTVGAFTAFFTVTRFATGLLGMPDTAAYLLSLLTALAAGALLGVLISSAVFAPLRRELSQFASSRPRKLVGIRRRDLHGIPTAELFDFRSHGALQSSEPFGILKPREKRIRAAVAGMDSHPLAAANVPFAAAPAFNRNKRPGFDPASTTSPFAAPVMS